VRSAFLAACLLPAASIAQTAAPEAFFPLLAPPLNIAIIDPDDEHRPEQVRAALSASNAAHLLNTTELHSFADADAVFVLLPDWPSVATLPYARRLAPVYDVVAGQPPENQAYATFESFNDGSQKAIVFINTAHLESVACTTEVIHVALQHGFNVNALQLPDGAC